MPIQPPGRFTDQWTPADIGKPQRRVSAAPLSATTRRRPGEPRLSFVGREVRLPRRFAGHKPAWKRLPALSHHPRPRRSSQHQVSAPTHARGEQSMGPRLYRVRRLTRSYAGLGVCARVLAKYFAAPSKLVRPPSPDSRALQPLVRTGTRRSKRSSGQAAAHRPSENTEWPGIARLSEPYFRRGKCARISPEAVSAGLGRLPSPCRIKRRELTNIERYDLDASRGPVQQADDSVATVT